MKFPHFKKFPPQTLRTFSLNVQALERHRTTGAVLKCKTCTSTQEEKERVAAAAKAGTNTNGNDETFKCASCKESLPLARFNRNQLSKKDKARCRKCVENAVQEEERNRKSSKHDKLEEIKTKIKEMDSKGNVQERLKYESQLSALEAEHVTGLKPIVMGAGRGSWRNRGGRGGGRGRVSSKK